MFELWSFLISHISNLFVTFSALTPSPSSNKGTVLLLKSFHIRRSFFLLTGRHYSLRELTRYFSMFKEFPIKIFLLKSKKLRQLRQSNLPPLFARRRSASYWAKSEMQLGYRKKYETSFERNPSVSSDLHKSDCYSLKSECKKILTTSTEADMYRSCQNFLRSLFRL